MKKTVIHDCGHKLSKVGNWTFDSLQLSKIEEARKGTLKAEDYMNWSLEVCPCCGEKL